LLCLVHTSGAASQPIAENDTYCQLVDETTVVIDAPGVLTNDIDPLGGLLTASFAGPIPGTQYGNVELNADGSFTYTQWSQGCFHDEFEYIAIADGLESEAANVAVRCPDVDARSNVNGWNGYKDNSSGLEPGEQIHSLGDVDGDGFDDYLRHRPLAWTAAEYGVCPESLPSCENQDVGGTLVVLGTPATGNDGGWFAGAVGLTGGVNLVGGLDRIGDINGDGLADVGLRLFGFAEEGDPTPDDSKDNYQLTQRYGVLFGRNDFHSFWNSNPHIGLPELVPNRGGDGSLGLVLGGVSDYEFPRWGHPMTPAGDMNGDSIDDLALGFCDNGDAVVAVLFGRPTYPAIYSPVYVPDSTESDVMLLVREDSCSESGALVPLDGDFDFNGDGWDDLLVGTVTTDPLGQDTGPTYVVYGSPSIGGEFDLARLDPEANPGGADGFRILPESGRVNFETAISLGDFDGDGFDDLLLGVPYSGASGLTDAGSVYLLYGESTIGSVAKVSDIRVGTRRGLIFEGSEEGERFGSKLNRAGDHDGDGRADAIVMDPDYSGFGLRTFVLLSDGLLREGWDGRLLSSEFDGHNGYSVSGEVPGDIVQDNAVVGLSTGADVNGDGCSDLLVGAKTNTVIYGGLDSFSACPPI